MHPYTYGLLNSFPSLHGPERVMKGIPGSPPDLRRIPSGCAFRTRCTFAFSACPQKVPSFYTPRADHHHHHVACFLYDQELHPEGAPEHFSRSHMRAAEEGNKSVEERGGIAEQVSSQPLKEGKSL